MIKDNFWQQVEVMPHGCWKWQRATTNGGYGHFSLNGKDVRAHRYAFEQSVGEIPQGHELDHLCRNPKCVNPQHLEVVTRSENTKRGLAPIMGRLFQKGKTHCPQGHPYSASNTYITREGYRQCRICHRQALKNYRGRQAGFVKVIPKTAKNKEGECQNH